MAGFYAIVLDWNFSGGGPLLDLIDSGARIATLRSKTSYNPDQDRTRVIRSAFTVTQLEPHGIQNSYTSNWNPAHICRLVAL